MAFPTQSAGLVAASSQYFSRADTASLSLTGNFTLEGWVNFTSTPASGNFFTFISKWTGGATNDRTYQFKLRNNAGVLGFYLLTSSDGIGTVVDIIETAWTPSTSTWYHIAVTASLGATATYKFYVNGAQQGTDQTGTVTGMTDTTAPFYLGVNGNTVDSFMDGRLSLWRVWNAALTGTQINSNKCTAFGSAQTNMVAEWSLDNVLTDASGNANTLTNVNTATFTTNVTSTCATSPPSFKSNLLLMRVG